MADGDRIMMMLLLLLMMMMSTQMGMAGIMIEDQVQPKKCGHVKGKSTVSREEAYSRVQAAVDARDEGKENLIRI
jgi:2-methylisocitrate lyase-like PEP mutase family enzyme